MIDVEVQLASSIRTLPADESVQCWATAVLKRFDRAAEVVIRIVDEQESAKLNQTYRHREGPTNVLSFSFEGPDNIPVNLLGDLVICAPVVEREASEQRKSFEGHFAHMVVHGILHLLGYDHVRQADARKMESLEIKILDGLGLPNPYEEAVSI